MDSDDKNLFPPEPSGAAESVPAELGTVTQEFPAVPGSSIPEDLRAPWGWVDLLLLVVITLGATIVLGILLGLGFMMFGVTPAQIQHSVSEKSFFVVLNQALLSLALLGYLVVQVRLRFNLPFWRTIGWRPLETGPIPRRIAYLGLVVGGFLFAVVIQLANAAFGTKAKLPIEAFFQDRRSALLLIVVGVLLAPLVEETIFRGYVYPVIARSFGVEAGVIATGTLFGLLHAQQLWGGWGQIALLVVVGIVFTYVRAATRTVLASYLLHVSYNSFLFFAFLVTSHGLRYLPAGH